MQKVELFFNAGDYEKQSNFIIYPKSLNKDDLDEILECVCEKFEQTYMEDGLDKFMQVEAYLKENHQYPDPTRVKLTSDWYYALVKKGSIIFRFGYDGRRETGSNRINSSIEGAFLEGINLEKANNKFQNKDIINEIGNCLPHNFEQLLISKKQNLFNKIKTQYNANNKLDSLFNHFYVACYGEEITISQNISCPPLPKYGLLDDIKYARKKIKKLLI